MLAGGPFGLGLPELLVILVVLVLIFGVNKVGDLGGALGKSVREFRRASREGDDDKPKISASSDASAEQPRAAGRFCANCGADLTEEAKFCAKCGAPTQAPVS